MGQVDRLEALDSTIRHSYREEKQVERPTWRRGHRPSGPLGGLLAVSPESGLGFRTRDKEEQMNERGAGLWFMASQKQSSLCESCWRCLNFLPWATTGFIQVLSNKMSIPWEKPKQSSSYLI